MNSSAPRNILVVEDLAVDFGTGLTDTVTWYRDNRAWWEPIKSGEYRAYYDEQYGQR